MIVMIRPADRFTKADVKVGAVCEKYLKSLWIDICRKKRYMCEWNCHRPELSQTNACVPERDRGGGFSLA